MMRWPVLFILGLSAAVVSPSKAAVIATCGPSEGYSYFFPDRSVNATGEWTQGPLNSVMIFIGDDKVSDVIIKGKIGEDDWTRSASDYGAPVYEINREDSLRHVLIFWGPHTELYAIDTHEKVFSMVSQKSGLVRGTHIFVGKCE
jgi:hypothetical protein